MDQVMLAAMKADDHPWITYSLKSLAPSKAERKSGDALAYDSVGDLTVSGVKKGNRDACHLHSNRKGDEDQRQDPDQDDRLWH